MSLNLSNSESHKNLPLNLVSDWTFRFRAAHRQLIKQKVLNCTYDQAIQVLVQEHGRFLKQSLKIVKRKIHDDVLAEFQQKLTELKPEEKFSVEVES